jgi:hypothetical protein
MKTKPLRPIQATADGIGISVEYMNEIINRIEDLVETANAQKPVSGNNVKISYLNTGAVINAVQ